MPSLYHDAPQTVIHILMHVRIAESCRGFAYISVSCFAAVRYQDELTFQTMGGNLVSYTCCLLASSASADGTCLS